jgi:hypothetical protein
MPSFDPTEPEPVSDFISKVMHDHNAASFQQRQPYAKKILRFPKHPLGPNERWASDGHNKTKAIGFPIYAFLDDATSKYLGVYIVPDNRNANIVTFCFLDVVEKVGGIPLQVSTDRGSETTKLFGVMNALRLSSELLRWHCCTNHSSCQSENDSGQNWITKYYLRMFMYAVSTTSLQNGDGFACDMTSRTTRLFSTKPVWTMGGLIRVTRNKGMCESLT